MPKAAPTRPSAVSGVQSLALDPVAALVDDLRQSAKACSRRACTRGPPRNACTTHTRASAGSRSKKERITNRPPRTRSRHGRPSSFACASSASTSPGCPRQRRQTRLTVLEQLVERTPRDLRASGYMTHHHRRVPCSSIAASAPARAASAGSPTPAPAGNRPRRDPPGESTPRGRTPTRGAEPTPGRARRATTPAPHSPREIPKPKPREREPRRRQNAEARELAVSAQGEERERERECISKLLKHLNTPPRRAACIPDMYLPTETTLNKLPHRN